MTDRVEVVTTGIDEYVQLVGGDPQASNAQMGLRVPALVPAGSGGLGRYLFQLARFEVDAGCVTHIRGWRLYASLGFDQVNGDTGTHRVIEQAICDPRWHPPDGNISLHLQDLGPPENGNTIGRDNLPMNPLNRDNFAFRNADGPALLFETATLASTFYTKLTAYTPPYAGKPPGRPLIDGGMEIMHDLRTGWREAGAWDSSLDVPVHGPKTVALFASLRQTNPSTRVALVPPTPFYGASFEEIFLLNWPNATYWRIAASLILDRKRT